MWNWYGVRRVSLASSCLNLHKKAEILESYSSDLRNIRMNTCSYFRTEWFFLSLPQTSQHHQLAGADASSSPCRKAWYRCVDRCRCSGRRRREAIGILPLPGSIIFQAELVMVPDLAVSTSLSLILSYLVSSCSRINTNVRICTVYMPKIS